MNQPLTKRDTLTLESAGCVGYLAGTVVGLVGFAGVVRLWAFVDGKSTFVWYTLFVVAVLLWISVTLTITVFTYSFTVTVRYEPRTLLLRRCIFGWCISAVEYAAADLDSVRVREVVLGEDEPNSRYLVLEFRDGRKIEFPLFSHDGDMETLQEWASES